MKRRSPIRFRADIGWEYRCDYCSNAKVAAYWPLTHEFWDYDKGMSRCRSCWNAYEAARRKSQSALAIVLPPATIAARLEARRAYAREWNSRNRAEQRRLEGRGRYERRVKAA